MKKIQPYKGILPFISSTLILLLCSKSPQSAVETKVDGELINGTRVIQMSLTKKSPTIQVHRGDAVEIIFSKNSVSQCSIPEILNVTSTETDSQLSVTFTAADTGSFQIISGDANTIATLKVIEFQAKKNIKIKNLSGKEAVEILKDTSIFILDVRTPGEFQQGHIPRANLLPVSELADNIDKISIPKNSPVFVYCRSGNRSAVAIQILTRNGFNNILHLHKGIKSWVGDIEM